MLHCQMPIRFSRKNESLHTPYVHMSYVSPSPYLERGYW